MTFGEALAVILAHEGGYSNLKADKGGETNLGVTRATWEAWTRKTCAPGEMRGLTVAKVRPLYKARYWDAIEGDDLPGPVALCVFDFAVNAGPARAAKMLQRIVGASVDGNIGPRTLDKVRGFVTARGVPELVRQFQNARRSYYRALDDFSHFGKGWLRRCDEVETSALKACV